MNIDVVQALTQSGLAGALIMVVFLWYNQQKIWPKQLNNMIEADVKSRESLVKALTLLTATIAEFHRTCFQTSKAMADTYQHLKAQVDRIEQILEDKRG